MIKASKEYRRKRLEKCTYYLKKYGNLPEARKQARLQEAFLPQTSAWLTALGRILKER